MAVYLESSLMCRSVAAEPEAANCACVGGGEGTILSAMTNGNALCDSPMIRKRPLGSSAPVAAMVVLVAVAAVYVGIKVGQYRSFGVSDFDTGIYSNVAWNIAGGRGYASDIVGGNHLGEHFSPIMAAFAPLYWIWESALVVLVAQAVGCGVGLWLIYRVLCEIVPSAIGGWQLLPVVLVAWVGLVYKPWVSALSYEFHPSTAIGVPVLAGAVLALHRKRLVVFWVLVGVLLLVKENTPLAVAGLGLYAWLVLGRPRLAIGLGVVAAVWAALVLGVFMPGLREGAWHHASRLGVWELWDQKGIYLLLLVGQLGLLPLLGWRALVAAVPLVALNLSVAYWPQFSVRFQYDDLSSVFVIVAAGHGAAWVLRVMRESPKQSRRLAGAGVLAMMLAGVVVAPLGQASWTAFGILSHICPTRQERQLAEELATFTEGVQAGQVIWAQDQLGPRLCHRVGHRSLYRAESLAAVRPADWLVISPVTPRYSNDPYERTKRLIQADRRMQRIYRTDVLEAYVCRRPVTAFPGAGNEVGD